MIVALRQDFMAVRSDEDRPADAQAVLRVVEDRRQHVEDHARLEYAQFTFAKLESLRLAPTGGNAAPNE